jgi:hypothetical protein
VKLIHERTRHTEVAYHHVYDYRDQPGAGFAFDSDAEGFVTLGNLNPAARANFEKCLDGTYDVIDLGVQRSEHSWTEPAAVRCDCRRTIWLEDAMYNGCDCGRGVNGSGQLLAPVSQWEPEDVYDTFGPRDSEY